MSDQSLLGSLLRTPTAAVHDRRSVLLLLEDIWNVDRERYWANLIEVMSRGTPSLSRVVFAESLVRLAIEGTDLEPLLNAVKFNDDNDSSARRAYRFLLEFAGADPNEFELAPWINACELVGPSGDVFLLGMAARLVLRTIDKRKELDVAQRDQLARAARALWYAAWRLPENTELLDVPLHAIIDTFDAAVGENTKAIAKLFGSETRPGKREALNRLAVDANKLMSAPDLVAQIYLWHVTEASALQARYDRELQKWRGEANAAQARGSKLPPMSPSPAAADPDVDHFLEEHAPLFLQRAPAVAASTFAKCISQWELRNDSPETLSSQTTALSLRGHVFLVPTRSARGLEGSPHVLSNGLRDALVRALGSAAPDTRSLVIDTLISEAAPTEVWAGIIDGARFSEDVRTIVVELIDQPDAIRLLARPIARLVESWGRNIPNDLRGRILAALQQLPEGGPKAIVEKSLARIDSNGTSAPPERGSEAVSNDDGDDYVAAIVGFGDDDHFELTGLGITSAELQEPQNKALRNMYRAADQQHRALSPMRADPSRIEPAQQAEAIGVLSTLKTCLLELGAHPALVTEGWCALARLASTIALLDVAETTSLLLEAASRDDALPWAHKSPRADLLNLGQAFPRAEAIPGLFALATERENEPALAALLRLAADSEPAVRFHVAWRVGTLAKLDPARVWPIVDSFVKDSDASIAAAAVNQLGPFFQIDRARSIALSDYTLRTRLGQSEADQHARRDALFQLVWYHLARANEVATTAIEFALQELRARPDGFNHLLHSYRTWLTLGESDQVEETAARLRCLALFTRIADTCISGIREIAAGGVNPNSPQRSQRPPLAILLEEVAINLYFASGAFNKKSGKNPLPSNTLARFHKEAGSLLFRIGTAGVISAADKVLDTLEYLLFDESKLISARTVLDQFVTVAQSAIEHGWGERYWLLDPIEHVLRRCVAERNESLYDSDMLAAWSKIIDALIDRGWYQAYELARDVDTSR